MTPTFGGATTTFLASGVEFVEAFTIVLAMGLTRSWRAAPHGYRRGPVGVVGGDGHRRHLP
jgi:uncharacterized membrane protein